VFRSWRTTSRQVTEQCGSCIDLPYNNTKQVRLLPHEQLRPSGSIENHLPIMAKQALREKGMVTNVLQLLKSDRR